MSKLATDLSVVTSVGLDLAKHVFQVHAVDASGKVIGITVPNYGASLLNTLNSPNYRITVPVY
jgi:hypothetical protein